MKEAGAKSFRIQNYIDMTGGICYGKFGIRDNPETFCTIMTESDSLIFVQDNLENPARFGIIKVLCSPASGFFFSCTKFLCMHVLFCACTQILCMHTNFVCAHKSNAYNKLLLNLTWVL